MIGPARRMPQLLPSVMAVILAVGAVVAAAVPLRPAEAAESRNDCSAYTSVVERQLKIPNGLLLAIALVESGQGGVPQPYALSLGQHSVIAHSAEEAARRIRAVADGAYVGCMQLSVRHHRGAFGSMEKMVDPKANVLYAGRLLRRLHGEAGSWRGALARYNGASSEQAQTYVCKVWNHLSELDWGSAKLLAPHGCGEMSPPEIAPRTRRAFRQAQVASVQE
ncbi:Lytic transglycosylase domain-containing protein [Azospirillaceae bacterium]